MRSAWVEMTIGGSGEMYPKYAFQAVLLMMIDELLW